jgi:hypothetical protein
VSSFARPRSGTWDGGYGARVRTFPFVPRSAAQLEIGDFWTVALSDGDLGVLQVRDLKGPGAGSRSSLVAGVVAWRGGRAPAATDLCGCLVLKQGLTDIRAFKEDGAQIIGNTSGTVPGAGLTSLGTTASAQSPRSGAGGP